jgi:hypothetical protein
MQDAEAAIWSRECCVEVRGSDLNLEKAMLRSQEAIW